MNISFLSDNTAPADSRIIDALAGANEGFEKSYGYDRFTEEVQEFIRNDFGGNSVFYPVLTGTGANVISLASVLSPFHSVICADTAHINVDECGAPERFLGCKIIGLKSENGKITPDMIKPCLHSAGFEHHNQPAMISVSQSVETGVVYRKAELEALSEFARENRLLLHLDGSRLANAAAFLGCSMGEASFGADIVSMGGTKNGMMMGEGIIVRNSEAVPNLKYVRKQGMQLFSKMRYISAQFIPYLKDGVWLENAKTANSNAKFLSDGFVSKGFRLAYPTESNGVFVYLDKKTVEKLSENFGFYVWDEETLLCRFMCSFATVKADVEALLNSL